MCKKKKLITESQNIKTKIINLKKQNTKILKKSLPQLKRVNQNYPPSKILCSAYSANNIPPNYLKKQQKFKNGLKRNNINVPAGQGDELNCKKTTLIISKKEKNLPKNHTILSTYQELI